MGEEVGKCTRGQRAAPKSKALNSHCRMMKVCWSGATLDKATGSQPGKGTDVFLGEGGQRRRAWVRRAGGTRDAASLTHAVWLGDTAQRDGQQPQPNSYPHSRPQQCNPGAGGALPTYRARVQWLTGTVHFTNPFPRTSCGLSLPVRSGSTRPDLGCARSAELNCDEPPPAVPLVACGGQARTQGAGWC